MKKIESTPEPHFKILIETFFNFCQEKFNAKPTFDGPSPRDFKMIVVALRKRSEENNFEWTEECASNTMRTFLQVAISDKWIAENFTTRILNSQKDKIFFKIASNGKYIQQKSTTGNAVNVTSAFSKIDQLFGSDAK